MDKWIPVQTGRGTVSIIPWYGYRADQHWAFERFLEERTREDWDTGKSLFMAARTKLGLAIEMAAQCSHQTILRCDPQSGGPPFLSQRPMFTECQQGPTGIVKACYPSDCYTNCISQVLCNKRDPPHKPPSGRGYRKRPRISPCHTGTDIDPSPPLPGIQGIGLQASTGIQDY